MKPEWVHSALIEKQADSEGMGSFSSDLNRADSEADMGSICSDSKAS